MMGTKLESIAYYLVWKWLSGHDNVVHALYHYFVEGKSPSTLIAKYGLSKHQVRGYVQRILEKSGGSRTIARAAIRMLYPLILRLKKPFRVTVTREEQPVMVMCLICGEEMLFEVFDTHLRVRHPSYIDAMTQLVIEKLCEVVRHGR